MHKTGLSLAFVTFVSVGVCAPSPSRADHPSNGWIVWASDRQDSRHEIYMMRADGSDVSRMTSTGARMPIWAPDSRWIAYETVPVGATRVMRPDKSEDKQVFGGKPIFWMWDDSGILCRDDDDFYLVDPDAETSSLIFRKSDFSRVADKDLNPGAIVTGGRWLVAHTNFYRNGGTGTNGNFNAYHAAAIFDFQNTDDIFFFGHGCEPTAPPDGDWVYHVCGGTFCDYHPDIYHMRISDRQDRSSYTPVMAHPDEDWGHEYFPRISNDGEWVTYGATTGCHDHDECDYEVFIHPLSGDNNNRERLTENAANDQWPHLYVGDLWSSEPEPRLSFSPTTLDFAAVSGEGNPVSQEVAVSNGGTGTLDDVTVSESADWLSVQRSGTGNDQTLTNQVDIGGLSTGNYDTSVDVSAANAANSPQSYGVHLEISESAVLTSIEVVAGNPMILAGDSTTLTAYPRDQFDAPIESDMNWSVSGGGTMNPVASPDPATEHSSVFTSDGNEGLFTINAASGGVTGSAQIQVSSLTLPLRINCGNNNYDVADWIRDDSFVSGGEDWVNPGTVDVTGEENAAPHDVYKSVRHSSPHSYSISAPDGTYLLRLHFADAYTDRSMDYFAEGEQILSDFDIASEAGGINRALVKDFRVEVTGGDGLQIEALSDGDVFEAGIELRAWVDDEPRPDGDGGSLDDGDGGSIEDGADGDAAAPDGASDADAGSGPVDGEDEVVVSGGCSGCTSAGDRGAALLFVLLFFVLPRRRS